MKRVFSVLCVFALLLSFSACGNRQAEPAAPEDGDMLSLRLIDGAGTQKLVLAGEKSGDVYTADAGELTVFLDGEAAAPDALENGMRLPQAISAAASATSMNAGKTYRCSAGSSAWSTSLSTWLHTSAIFPDERRTDHGI